MPIIFYDDETKPFDKRIDEHEQNITNIKNKGSYYFGKSANADGDGLPGLEYQYDMLPHLPTIKDKSSPTKGTGWYPRGENGSDHGVDYNLYFDRFKSANPITGDAANSGFSYVIFTQPYLNLSTQIEETIMKSVEYASEEHILLHKSQEKKAEEEKKQTNTESNPSEEKDIAKANTLSDPFLTDMALRYPLLMNMLSREKLTKVFYLLTNLNSGISASDIVMNTMTVGENFRTPIKMELPKNDLDSHICGELSIQFIETSDMEILNTIKIWFHYMVGIKKGSAMPRGKHLEGNVIDYMCSIYHFVVGPDGETLYYWAKYTGCYPTAIPYSAYGVSNTDHGLIIPTVPFKYQYFEALEPEILNDFNKIMNVGTLLDYNKTGYFKTINSLEQSCKRIFSFFTNNKELEDAENDYDKAFKNGPTHISFYVNPEYTRLLGIRKYISKGGVQLSKYKLIFGYDALKTDETIAQTHSYIFENENGGTDGGFIGSIKRLKLKPFSSAIGLGNVKFKTLNNTYKKVSKTVSNVYKKAQSTKKTIQNKKSQAESLKQKALNAKNKYEKAKKEISDKLKVISNAIKAARNEFNKVRDVYTAAVRTIDYLTNQYKQFIINRAKFAKALDDAITDALNAEKSLSEAIKSGNAMFIAIARGNLNAANRNLRKTKRNLDNTDREMNKTQKDINTANNSQQKAITNMENIENTINNLQKKYNAGI